MTTQPTVEIKALDNSTKTLSPEALQAFRAGFRGTVLLPTDGPYEEARKIWNAMIDRRPAIIAQCTGTADVVHAVNFAREQGLLSSVRGGGHNIAGLAICDG